MRLDRRLVRARTANDVALQPEADCTRRPRMRDPRSRIDGRTICAGDAQAEGRIGGTVDRFVRHRDGQKPLESMQPIGRLIAVMIQAPCEDANLIKIVWKPAARRRKQSQVFGHRSRSGRRRRLRSRRRSACIGLDGGFRLDVTFVAGTAAVGSFATICTRFLARLTTIVDHRRQRIDSHHSLPLGILPDGIGNIYIHAASQQPAGIAIAVAHQPPVFHGNLCRLRGLLPSRLRRNGTRNLVRNRGALQQRDMAVAGNKIEMLRLPTRREVKIKIVTKLRCGHDWILRMLHGQMLIRIILRLLDHGMILQPPNLAVLRPHLVKAAAMLDDLQPLAVFDQRHAVGDSRNTIAQIDLARRDVNIAVRMRLEALAAGQTGKQRQKEEQAGKDQHPGCAQTCYRSHCAALRAYQKLLRLPPQNSSEKNFTSGQSVSRSASFPLQEDTMFLQRFRNLSPIRNAESEITTSFGIDSIRRMDAAIQAMNRRRFLTGVGVAGAVAGAAALTGCGSSGPIAMAQSTVTADTAQQIFTAALIAEDLATTMYFNALVGGVIQDPNLAGTGGTATNVTSNGSVANVGYLRGALSEEIQHADLMRTQLNISAATSDPVQTFYFPTGTFNTLTNFFPVLVALETAFIAAYMTAVEEFSLMIGGVSPYSSTQMSAGGSAYTSAQLSEFAKICAAILGVEAEHRALARAIPSGTTFASMSILPADNDCYESTDTLTSVYNGSASAAAALGPFLTQGSGTTAYSLQTALSGSASIQLACTGSVPSA